MVSKHINRDFSAHRRSVIRPYDEYVKFEIFSFDPKHTKEYLSESNTLSKGQNCKSRHWKSWACYQSNDKINNMTFNIKYNVIEAGDYRIDLVYEKYDSMYTGADKSYNNSKNLTGGCTISYDDTVVYDKDFKFEGENNVIKRKTIFKHLNKYNHSLSIEVPPNCFFYGIIIRKIKKYIGDNLDSSGTNLMITSASYTKSSSTKPSELSVEIGYDSDFVCDDSPSGFYFDYRDECNFYLKNNEGDIIRVFGGYISSVLPDADLTKITIACADRLIDGQNKYVLDKITLNKGASDTKEDDYSDEMTMDFKSYPHALKYLCNLHENTLKNNISSDYTVDGEKFHKGLTISFGKKKKVKKITTTNGLSSVAKNYIVVRNDSNGEVKQVWNLYNAKDYAKTPFELTNNPFMHISYGLGSTVQTRKSKVTETVDTSDTTAGAVKWSKCGVSADKKYVMFIGQPSNNAMSKKYGYRSIMKRIYKNKCPYCGKSELRWDDSHGNGCITGNGHSGNKSSVTEGEITCNHCDMDFEGVSGKEKINGSKRKLTPVTNPVKSSEAERKKLSSGKMVAVPTSSVELTPDSIFKAITNLAFKYNYKWGAGSSTYSKMKKTGYGDCWAFSDLIFTELKKYKVTCKIVEYKTNASGHHRSVLYKDANNNWVDFPYRQYGWDKKYNNMLNNTSGSKTGGRINLFKGSNIAHAKGTSSTTKSQTTEVTTTTGYDKSKPYQAYIKLTYSLQGTFSAKKYNLYLGFTLPTPVNSKINAWNNGFDLTWINNQIRETTLDTSLMEIIRPLHGGNENLRVFLQSIKFIAPIKKPSSNNDDNEKNDVDWYKFDKSTNDKSSCKMNLYQIVFDDIPSQHTPSSSDMPTCGKSVNSVVEDIVKEANYLVDMEYGLHRKQDIIHFRVNDNTSESFTASEGDNNNILSWNSISYSPVSSLANMSMVVFMMDDGNYHYVDTRDASSILRYGEQATLTTNNGAITKNQAYYMATKSDKLNPEQTYTYTITVPNYPNIRLGDLVKVVANAKKLNNLKEVESISIKYSVGNMPRIQTEIGLGELAPNIQLSKNIRKLREDAKTDTTSFSSSAIPVTEEIYYLWDK